MKAHGAWHATPEGGTGFEGPEPLGSSIGRGPARCGDGGGLANFLALSPPSRRKNSQKNPPVSFRLHNGPAMMDLISPRRPSVALFAGEQFDAGQRSDHPFQVF